jgi:cytoskeletal protein RodZ
MANGILGVKSWRLRKGITLEAIAAHTKLSTRHLTAIEDGDFGSLPGGIYNTCYIRQYARAIGFDEADLLAYYTKESTPPVINEEATTSSWSRWSAALPYLRARVIQPAISSSK